MPQNHLATLSYAFPAAVRPEFIAACAQVNLEPPLSSAQKFTVDVGGELLTIPYRVYFEPSILQAKADFTPLGWTTLNLLFTRHHNGFIRAQCLRQVIPLAPPWVIPYVLQLVGEYVVEILLFIKQALVAMERAHWAAFLAANPCFMLRPNTESAATGIATTAPNTLTGSTMWAMRSCIFWIICRNSQGASYATNTSVLFVCARTSTDSAFP